MNFNNKDLKNTMLMVIDKLKNNPDKIQIVLDDVYNLSENKLE